MPGVKNWGVVVALAACVVASFGFASRLWTWVLHFDPGFVFAHPPAPTGPPLSSGVTILLIDGLRLDASRRMPALNALRSRGADIEAQVGTPSFSRPGRATVAVGAPPDIHGVTTNRQRRMLSIDNLFRRVGAVGGTCRVAGSTIWSGLFGDDIAKCGRYQPGEGKEGPGAFVRQVGAVRESQERGLAFILQQPAMLRVADIISTDFAAHEYGGASPEYAAEVARADRSVAELAAQLDLSTTTLVVTADHGHRDQGGHGGSEPAVLAIPVVMVGAGIAPSTRASAEQADVAPTVAALLGLPLPTGSSGHPLTSVMTADPEKTALVERAAAAQQAAFGLAIAGRFSVSPGGAAVPGWRASRHAYEDEARSDRLWLALFLTLALLAVGIGVVSLVRPSKVGATAGLLSGGAAIAAWSRWFLPPMSFSAINYDEMLIPFFARIMVIAAMIAAGSMAVAVLLAPRHAPTGRPPSRASSAGVVGLIESLGLLGATLAAWLHHGLLLPAALPRPDRMVEAYALTLSTGSVALISLVVMAALGLLDRRARSSGPGMEGRSPSYESPAS